jgi:hypothetical protein
MRVLIVVLVLASICCPSIRHVIERESMKVFTDDRDRYFDEIDAAITLPITRFALAEGR